MSDSIPNPNEHLSLREASEIFGYHPDHLGRLIREGKLYGKRAGRSWVTTRAALTHYASGNHDLAAQAPLLSSPEYVSLKEASELSGYHPDHLSRLIRQGALYGKRAGRGWATTRVALANYLSGNEELAKQEVGVDPRLALSGSTPGLNLDELEEGVDEPSPVQPSVGLEKVVAAPPPVPAPAPAVSAPTPAPRVALRAPRKRVLGARSIALILAAPVAGALLSFGVLAALGNEAGAGSLQGIASRVKGVVEGAANIALQGFSGTFLQDYSGEFATLNTKLDKVGQGVEELLGRTPEVVREEVAVTEVTNNITQEVTNLTQENITQEVSDEHILATVEGNDLAGLSVAGRSDLANVNVEGRLAVDGTLAVASALSARSISAGGIEVGNAELGSLIVADSAILAGDIELGGTLATVAITSTDWNISVAGVADFSQLIVDNLQLDGNTLSSLEGGITFAPLADQHVSFSLAGAGNFIVNTDDLVVDTATGNVSSAGQLQLPTTGSSAGILLGGDVALYRTASNRLNLGDDDILTFPNRDSDDDIFAESAVSGDAFYRFQVTADGTLAWGPGNALRDTNLYRDDFNTLATDDSFEVGGNLTVTGDLSVFGISANNGDVVLGDAVTDTITFTGVVNSDITPETSTTYDLGSASRRWANGYFDTVTANTLTGVVAGGATTSSDWTINSDNASANTELSTLSFETGTGDFNSTLQWNAAGDAGRVAGFDDTFLFNQPLAIYSEVSGGNQTFTSGTLFSYSQPATHAITQSGALTGINLDFSSNITNTTGAQTGIALTLKDGSVSGGSVGIRLAGTADYGIDLSPATYNLGAIILPTGTTPASGIDFSSSGGETVLYRSAAGTLSTNGRFTVGAGSSRGVLFGGDALLYRASANSLRTDSSLIIDDNLEVVGNTIGTYALFQNSLYVWEAYEFGGTTISDAGIETALDILSDGQLQLPTSGSAAGIVLGGDVQLYRGATNRLDLASGDSLNIVEGSLSIDTGTGRFNIQDYTEPTGGASAALIATQQRGLIIKERSDMNGGLWLYGGSSNGGVGSRGAIGVGLGGDNATTLVFNTSASMIRFWDGDIQFRGQTGLTAGTTGTPTLLGTISSAGQLQLPTTGSSAGLLLGGDVQLYRNAANELRLNSGSSFTVDGSYFAVLNASSSTATVFASRATGQTQNPFRIGANGTFSWGNGTDAADTALYRGATNRLDLASGDSFYVTAGGVGIGVAPDNNKALRVERTISSSDVATLNQLQLSGSITATGASSLIGFLRIAPTASTVDGVTTPYVASAFFQEPNIVLENGGGTAIGATVYIQDAPTEAALNYGLYVAGGSTRLNGDLLFQGDTNLYRSAANRLQTDDDFYIARGSSRAIVQIESSNTFGPELRLSSSDTGAKEWRIGSAGTGNSGGGVTAGDLFFYNGTDSQMRALLTEGGQFSVPATGSSAGLLIGGDTQLYRGAADRLDLASGDSLNIVGGDLAVNSDDFYVQQSTGRVGIGTTGPNARLHIDSSTSAANMFEISRISTNNSLRILNYNGTNTAYNIQTTSDNWDTAFDVLSLKATGTAVGVGYADLTGVTGALLVNGNVGIGTTNPSNKLEVVGNLGLTSNNPLLFLGPANGTFTSTNYHTLGYALNDGYHVSNSLAGDFTIGARASANIRFGTSTSGIPTARLNILSDGKVGVGTTDPQSILHVRAGSSNSVLSGLTLGNESTAENVGVAIDFRNHTTTSVNTARIIAQRTTAANSNSELQFWNFIGGALQEALTINESGQIQAPFTGSSAGLLIGGDVQLYRSAANQLTIPDSVLVQDGSLWVKTAGGAQQTNIRLGVFEDSASTALYEFSTADVGGDKLDLHSNRWASNVIFSRSSVDGYQEVAAFQGDDNAGNRLYIYDATTTTANIVLRSNTYSYFNGGDVIIGTNATPLDKLEVFGASKNLRINNTDETEAGIIFSDAQDVNGQNASLLFDASSHLLSTYVNNSAVARFSSAGQFQLPTTGSSAGLLLGGDVQLYRGAANRLDLAGGDSLSILSGSLTVGASSGVERFNLFGGNFFINGTDSTPGIGTRYQYDTAANSFWINPINDNALAIGGTGSTPPTSGAINILSSSGNVGIGTATPGTLLHLNGGTDTGLIANSGMAILGNATSTHLSIDANEIMAKASGTTAGTLWVQSEGGGVRFLEAAKGTFTVNSDAISVNTSNQISMGGPLTLRKGDGSSLDFGRLYGGNDGNDYIEINGAGSDDHISFVLASELARITGAGQLQLPTTGSSAGLLIGGDVQLYRGGANSLFLGQDDNVRFTGSTTSANVIQAIVSGDSNYRFRVQANGTLVWGSGAASEDVSLFRSTTDTLAVSDNFIIGATTAASETLSHSDFSLSGDDLFVAGSAGIEGSVYTDGEFIVGGATSILGDGYLRVGGEGSALLARAARVSGSLTTSGNEITDRDRVAPEEGDGRNPNDSSYGVWEASTNLLPNGGFETNVSDWSINTEGTFEQDTTRAKFGSASGKLTSDGANSLSRVLTNLSGETLTQGTVYTASIWVYAEGSVVGKNMQLLLWESGGSQGSQALNIISGSYSPTLQAGWNRYTVTASLVQSDRTSIQLYVGGTPGLGWDDGTVVYFDGAQVEMQPVATPYIETDGGTASRNGSKVEAPKDFIDETEGWVAIRVRMGWDSSIGTPHVSPARAWSIGEFSDPDGWMGIAYQSGSWRMDRFETSANRTYAAKASSWSKGDIITIIGAWTSSEVKISIDGSDFESASQSTIPSLSSTLMEIGNEGEAGADLSINSDILWAASGTGTLSDSDAATIHNFGNKDPRISKLPSNSAAKFVWSADNAWYEGADAVPQSILTLDDVDLYRSAAETLATNSNLFISREGDAAIRLQSKAAIGAGVNTDSGGENPGTLTSDGSSGGSLSWTTPSNASLSNDAYAVATASGDVTTHYLKATNFDFDIPENAVITGIEVAVERKASSVAQVSLIGSGSAATFGPGSPGTTSVCQHSSTQVGDFLVAYLIKDTGTAVAPGDWTFSNDLAVGAASAYTKVASQGGSTCYAGFGSSNVNQGRVIIVTFRGVDTADPIDVTRSAGNTTTVPSITTTGPGRLVLFEGSESNSTNIPNAPSGFTNWGGFSVSAGGNGPYSFGFSYRSFPSTGATGDMTQGTTIDNLKAVALKPANPSNDSRLSLVKADGSIGATNKGDVTTAWPSSDATVSYGGAADMWGESLSASDVNDTDFGVVVAVEALNGITVSVDSIVMSVHYRDSADVDWVFGSDHGSAGVFTISRSSALGTSTHLTIDESGVNVTGGTVNSLDYAELFPSSEPVAKGEIVEIDPGEEAVRRSTQAYGDAVVGIVSTQPASVLEGGRIIFVNGEYKLDPMKPAIALAGRVPVKVSNENGDIKPGDAITSSSVPGVGMKATQPGRIVGIALTGFESDDEEEGDEADIVTGTVTVFVSTGYHIPNEYFEALAEGEEGGAAAFFQNFVDLVLKVRTLVASLVTTERLEVTDPYGITIYDTITGEPYCVVSVNGKLESIAGTCEEVAEGIEPTPEEQQIEEETVQEPDAEPEGQTEEQDAESVVEESQQEGAPAEVEEEEVEQIEHGTQQPQEEGSGEEQLQEPQPQEEPTQEEAPQPQEQAADEGEVQDSAPSQSEPAVGEEEAAPQS